MADNDELHLRDRLSRLKSLGLLRGASITGELARLQRQLERTSEPTDEEIWQHVELARHPDRPYTLDYVERIFEDFVELHGDRARAEDPAMIAGLGRFNGQTVALLGQQKGRDTHERIRRNYGMTYPEGYRKAMRVMDLAERHRFPIVSLVDTPGAYPGVAAEQHGQGGAIARSQALMSRLTIPIVACVIGEGGSGGAIAIALADRVLMMENAMYSVISPEGCAAILWRTGEERVKAAAALKPDAVHTLELGVIDAIVPEPEGGAHANWDEAARLLGEALRSSLEDLSSLPGEELRRRRRDRFRALGVYASSASEPVKSPARPEAGAPKKAKRAAKKAS
jgi:acetyl-CoA carboxylase carboxyl transferase subunit alpha